MSGRAREAERARVEACLRRCGTLRPDQPTPNVRVEFPSAMLWALRQGVHDGLGGRP